MFKINFKNVWFYREKPLMLHQIKAWLKEDLFSIKGLSACPLLCLWTAYWILPPSKFSNVLAILKPLSPPSCWVSSEGRWQEALKKPESHNSGLWANGSPLLYLSRNSREGVDIWRCRFTACFYNQWTPKLLPFSATSWHRRGTRNPFILKKDWVQQQGSLLSSHRSFPN